MCVGKNSLEDLDWSALRFTFKWILMRTNVQSQKTLNPKKTKRFLFRFAELVVNHRASALQTRVMKKEKNG